MTVLYSKKSIVAVLLLGLLLSYSIPFGVSYASPMETIIIAPEKLEGIVGTPINTEDIFVQKITYTNVENIKDIQVTDDNGNEIKIFPKSDYKAIVKQKSTGKVLGFLQLNPKEGEKKVAIGTALKGEFLFYQDGRVFNKLNLAEEGKIYFYREPKTSSSRPLILFIGNVQDGEFEYADYVRITAENIELRR